MRNFPEVTLHRTVLEARDARTPAGSSIRRQTASDSPGGSRFASQRPHSSDSHTGTVDRLRRGAGIGLSPPEHFWRAGTARTDPLDSFVVRFLFFIVVQKSLKTKARILKKLKKIFFQPNHLETCMKTKVNSLINSFMDNPTFCHRQRRDTSLSDTPRRVVASAAMNTFV